MAIRYYRATTPGVCPLFPVWEPAHFYLQEWSRYFHNLDSWTKRQVQIIEWGDILSQTKAHFPRPHFLPWDWLLPETIHSLQDGTVLMPEPPKTSEPSLHHLRISHDPYAPVLTHQCYLHQTVPHQGCLASLPTRSWYRRTVCDRITMILQRLVRYSSAIQSAISVHLRR